MTEPIPVAVIGAGRIGRLHAEHLAWRLPEARLVAVVDPRLEVAQACASACRAERAVADYREVLEDPAVEAVIICSATDTHAAIIAEAAAAGKHIFCEKPIAHDLAAIDRALAAVEAAGVLFQVGFNRRFDPTFRRVHELVAAGEIGTPHILRITSRDPALPPLDYVRVSGGLFLDMTIHDFDMARYLMGDEVEEVCAFGGVLIDPAIGRAGDIDTAVVMLRFADGALGAIDNSRQAVYGYDQRVEVFGASGAITVSNNTPHSAVVSKADGVHGPKPLYFFVERYADSYLAEMRAFLESVRAGSPPPVTGADGRAPVAIALAARRSLDERRPVRLAEIG